MLKTQVFTKKSQIYSVDIVYQFLTETQNGQYTVLFFNNLNSFAWVCCLLLAVTSVFSGISPPGHSS